MSDERTPEEKEIDRIAKYKRVFASPEGEEILRDMMLRYYMVSGTYFHEPHHMYFREGARSVISDILEIMEVDPHKYREMLSRISEDQLGFDID